MTNVSKATVEYRNIVLDYLKAVESSNEALRNIYPGTYNTTRQKLATEFTIQAERLAMPAEVIHIDEIKPVLEMVRTGKKPEVKRK